MTFAQMATARYLRNKNPWREPRVERANRMSHAKPFRIQVTDADLDELKARIESTRWPEAETVDDWSQGMPLAYAQELAEYWCHQYNWREREANLNRFDHWIDEVNGLDIHFIHQRSKNVDAFPLLITHGWPGSVAEFSKVIEPLVDPEAHGGSAADAFHVICPSLPGYGFSGKPNESGWGVAKIALTWDSLVASLGYDHYGAQGGDWGSAVTTQLGRNGGRCIAIHTNMPIGRPTPESLENPDEIEKAALERLGYYQESDSGYSKQQSTRPQTVGYGLVDSPVGQMTWIVEKFWSWMDCDGHPENILTKDELLDNVMIYWITKSGASSARLYWESFGQFSEGDPVEVPTGVASFPAEIIRSPRRWCESRYNITHWTDMERGGHFGAFEQPELFVDDVRTFFANVRP